MSEDKNKTPLYYPRKMRTGWCVAHEVTAAGVTIERYGIHCQTYAEAYRRAEVMNRKQEAEVEVGRAYRSRGSHDSLEPSSPERRGWAVMSEKVSTITLRLTAEEAAQLEILKDIIGKKSGSEAIKYVVKEYPRFCTHYKQEAKEHGELKRKYREQGEAVRGFLSALDKLEKAGKEKE